MLLIQILQQHVTVRRLALVLAHIIPPAAYRARKSPWHVGLLADLRDRMEVSSDGEDNTARARETPQGLALRAEVVVIDRLVLLGSEPADCARFAVLGADTVRPRERIIDLDEVVVL